MTPSTKQALAASLKKLLEKKPLDAITVKEIVEDCEVNRQTFYYHFQDIYDLLRFLMDGDTDLVLRDTPSWHEGLLGAFQYIRENQAALYHVFRSTGREHLDCQIYSISRKIACIALEVEWAGLTLDQADRDFLTEFFMYALAGLLFGWVSRDMRDEPRDLVDRAAHLLEGEFHRAVEKFKK